MSNILEVTKNASARLSDGLTYGYIRGEDKIRNMKMPRRGEESGAGVVEWILIIAIVVVLVYVVGKIIFDNVSDAAEKTGKCIASANKVKTGVTTDC